MLILFCFKFAESSDYVFLRWSLNNPILLVFNEKEIVVHFLQQTYLRILRTGNHVNLGYYPKDVGLRILVQIMISI